MEINANTKIGVLIRHKPEALEAIVSISPRFEKLRNPILRKLIAGKTSIAMASRIGGCLPVDFFNKLTPLGFKIRTGEVIKPAIETNGIPAFMQQLHKLKIIELDVRPILDRSEDPLKEILALVSSMKNGHVLKIINSFEPVPLMLLLGTQGFENYARYIGPDLVETYFCKTQQAATSLTTAETVDDWDVIFKCFNGNLQTIDVRQLEMPLPLMTIIEAIEKLPAEKALFVHHKRVPVFLFPELRTRNFEYRLKKISETEIDLLIFRTQHASSKL